jgi:transposase
LISPPGQATVYCIDPSRGAAIPGAHFAGLQAQQAIIVCDRYSAYKKLARLALNILLAFCWAPMRRDFLDAGRAFAELQEWALEWKERIGTLYHLNQLRLEQWAPERPIGEQCAGFHQHHAALLGRMQDMHEEATRVLAQAGAPGAGLLKIALLPKSWDRVPMTKAARCSPKIAQGCPWG